MRDFNVERVFKSQLTPRIEHNPSTTRAKHLLNIAFIVYSHIFSYLGGKSFAKSLC